MTGACRIRYRTIRGGAYASEVTTLWRYINLFIIIIIIIIIIMLFLKRTYVGKARRSNGKTLLQPSRGRKN